jgi:ParB-like chromosome segregation protein Spo0J
MTGHKPRLTKFQAYRVERIARGQIQNAGYNPRTIDKHAKQRLKASLRKNGLVETLVWNKRTGNIVGGHQRLANLDELEGTPDYALDVAVIDVSEKREKEINVALNNPSIQGTYDLALLETLLREEGFDFDAAGFDSTELQVLLGDAAPVENNLFDEEKAPPAVKDDLKQLDEIARMKREKKEYKEAAADRDDTEFYVVAVFKDRAARESFMEALGRDKDERYIDGNELATRCGLSN